MNKHELTSLIQESVRKSLHEELDQKGQVQEVLRSLESTKRTLQLALQVLDHISKGLTSLPSSSLVDAGSDLAGYTAEFDDNLHAVMDLIKGKHPETGHIPRDM